uniref:Peroxisomal membrane protein 11B n=1 Tax=Aceria tosichella TaxID=561515 RepID=A0A6G1S7V1_9ACAR
MGSLEKIVKFNAQTVGREKLIRLCQYTTKFVNSILHLYHTRYGKGGVGLLELLYRLRELEQYFISCRRLVSFGRCSDQLYSAMRSMQLNDPIIRMTASTSKFWLSIQMFAEHVLWLNQIGLFKSDKQLWADRANRFWLYSVSTNLLRDFYELICVVQQRRSRDKDNLDSELRNFKLSTPIKWIKRNPKLSCDLIKNSCDFWIPYTAVNKIPIHSSVIALLGIISTTMGILQVYDREYRLSPS